jgi:hypothetical protein
MIFKVRDQSQNLVNPDAVKADDLTSLNRIPKKLYKFVIQFPIVLRRSFRQLQILQSNSSPLTLSSAAAFPHKKMPSSETSPLFASNF